MISETVIQHACETPDAIAMVDDKRTLTYRELVWGGNMMADHYERLTPRAEFGDKVGLLIPPSAAFAVAFGACRWIGRIPLPLNYLLKPEEIVGIVRDADLRVIFTVEYFQPLVEAVNAGLRAAGAREVKIVCMESLTFEKPGMLAMAQIALNPKNLAKYLKPLPARHPDDVAVIMYTSGSAGVPKGVMLTNKNLESNADDAVAFAQFTQKTVFLGCLPMFHTLGLQGSFLIPMKLGSKVIYQARFSPVGVFELVKKHGIEVLIMVPTMYAVMAAAKSAHKDSLAGVKYCFSGGEPLPVSLIKAYKEKFDITLFEAFGLTETSPIATLNLPWDNKAGSVGKAIPHVQLKIVDDAGKELPRNTDGELYIKGPNVMKGYYNRPDLTAEVMTPEGWFKTGDVAKIDDEGFLFITGRKKDMIIMAGEKIFPREIEDALRQHPAVVVAAVIGMKDGARGEMPVAFVQLKPDAELGASKPTVNDLRNFVRERIAPYKTPREVYIMAELPRNATGKVQKRDLAGLIPPA